MQKAIWDYDPKTIDLKNPKIKAWYLSRKIKMADYEGISRKDLKEYLPKLDIDTSMKELLTNFIFQNV